MAVEMYRRLLLLSVKYSPSVRCHVSVAKRAPLSFHNQHLLAKRTPLLFLLAKQSLSTSCSLMASHHTEQQDAVRRLLPELLTSKSKENVKGSPGQTLMMSEADIRQVCSHYLQLSDPAKVDFLTALSELCGTNHEGAIKAAKKLESIQDTEDDAALFQYEQRLTQSLTPGYRLLFTHIGRLEDGVKFLVDMRADILTLLHQQKPANDHHMRALNTTLKEMLSHWFSAGLLQLQMITWQSSCDMLQKISEYEAVHPVRGWADLKRRVGPYRRCFVYTHSSMPLEPVMVLHTALTDHIPSNVQSIVGERKGQQTTNAPLASEQPEDPEHIKSAIFYSISSTQKGLRGVDLGNYLIKQAVRTLQANFPYLTTFCTLSPIPGFTGWLLAEITRLQKGENTTQLFNSEELQKVHSVCGRTDQSELATVGRLLATNQWTQSKELVSILEKPLLRLCARYLYAEKHRKFALDSVANFHLRNGAVMWRLNWMGDTSARGMTSSCGMMVNYRYFLESTLSNSQNYSENQTIAVTQQILDLVEEERSLHRKSQL
ncbi:malonyl-CoA decarboxylase, mitochondrial-like [Asterias amurensis]|uniref:malonyl-CoA decarboxylase, mitochondrial-like n=1 Tax=Asterias amurensis TaxID=7602 RepID=UPI003AB57908